MAALFDGLVKLMISAGGGDRAVVIGEGSPVVDGPNGSSNIISKWEFIDDIPEASRPPRTGSFVEPVEEVETDSNKKKSKKKKNKRKKRSNSVNSPEESRKSVQWGDVEEVLFTRELGFHTVPHNGNFPLGLGEEVGRFSATIAQHFAAGQIRLLDRATEIGLDISALKPEEIRPRLDSEDEDTALRISLETRQHDYRRGYNPLFRPLSEADRSPHRRFCSALFLPPYRFFLRIVVLGNISRQAAVEGVGTVTALHKDLAEIRKSRDAVGCSCKQTKLDKLNVAKLKAELTAHQNSALEEAALKAQQSEVGTGSEAPPEGFPLETLSPKQIEAMSKSELVNRLRGVYKSCPLCVLNDCACVAAGVGCHSNVCCCYRAGGVKHSCENPHEARAYNAETVREYRKQFITATPSKSPGLNVSTPLQRSRAYST
jgi:hypothetical protein